MAGVGLAYALFYSFLSVFVTLSYMLQRLGIDGVSVCPCVCRSHAGNASKLLQMNEDIPTLSEQNTLVYKVQQCICFINIVTIFSNISKMAQYSVIITMAD